MGKVIIISLFLGLFLISFFSASGQYSYTYCYNKTFSFGTYTLCWDDKILDQEKFWDSNLINILQNHQLTIFDESGQLVYEKRFVEKWSGVMKEDLWQMNNAGGIIIHTENCDNFDECIVFYNEMQVKGERKFTHYIR